MLECKKLYFKPERILRPNIFSVSPTKTVGLFTFHTVDSFLRNMIGIFGGKGFFVSSIIKKRCFQLSQAWDMGGSSISDGLVSRVQQKWSNLGVQDNLSENFHSSTTHPSHSLHNRTYFFSVFHCSHHLF